jgi:hypothetical protein
MHAKFEFAGLQKDQANDETVFVTFGVKVFFPLFWGRQFHKAVCC